MHAPVRGIYLNRLSQKPAPEIAQWLPKSRAMYIHIELHNHLNALNWSGATARVVNRKLTRKPLWTQK